HEATCIKYIVKEIQKELNNITSITIDENLIGLGYRTQEVISLLKGRDDVSMIGIWGMGGAGKTTLARALFDEISCDFEGVSFLENIRQLSQQYGIQHVQKFLLEDVINDENLRVRSVVDGKRMLLNRLSHKKVLVVLDDVDALSQLDALAGSLNWFGKGSKIVITTRDEHVLIGHGVNYKNIYKINLLNDNEASQLFKRYAFKRSIPSKEYEEASQQVVHYATGLPLTLKVLGSFLCGRSLAEWKSALSKLKMIPEKETMEILKISYDGLDNEYQEVFLHIACFFRGWEKDTVFRILESCEFYPHIVTKVLEQKSLISISKECLGMHDLIQEMGKDIVRRMQTNELGRRTRLWEPHDIVEVLEENTAGKEEIKAIVAENLNEVSVNISEAFRNMEKLTLLYFHAVTEQKTLRGPAYLPNELRWLTWNYFSLDYLPDSFHANKLVGLELPRSKIIQLWDKTEVKVLHNLKFLDLSYSKLTVTPDFNQIPNLERLNLGFCLNLLEIDTSVGVLQRLVYLSLSGCSNLKKLPESLGLLVCLEEGAYVSHCRLKNAFNECLPNTINGLYRLETLDLHHCSNLEELPEDLDNLECLENLVASSTSLTHLPDTLTRLKALKTLDLHHCLSIEMPLNLGAVAVGQNLVSLNLSSCIQLEEFPESLGNLKNLLKLDLSHNMIQELPSSIGNLTRLVRLPENIDQLVSLENLIVSSTGIRSLPNNIRRCKHVKILNVSDCKSLTYLPPALGDMESLEVLRASNSAIIVIPDSICFSKFLKVLDFRGCSNLQELPMYLSFIDSLEEIYISGTSVWSCPPIPMDL
ncbi:putative P-loop containing nucleoside triphosphate hydrolase, partial [Tanacetum coccineum]